jgi:trans-AT polyketide synthase/acyltransferase/oxidoreductase domain-containing protein
LAWAQAPVELRYMCYADANECEVSRELLDRFERANPSIKVVVDKVGFNVVREQLETRVFGRPLAAVYEETKAYYLPRRPEVIARAEQDPKHRMALVFRWYFVHSSRLARRGDPAGRADFQIHCGPALGAFNQLVRGTPREDWRQRHVDEIAGLLMEGAAAVLRERWAALAVN